MKPELSHPPRIALALAGGGLLGAIDGIGLSEKLWQHGISLHHETLDDPKRHLSAPAKPTSQVGRAIANLQEIMDDLGHVVRSVSHQSKPSW